MKAISIVNPKGGSGKSTLATNLAGYLARRNAAVLLGDVDRQLSSKLWLSLRPPSLPTIATWDIGPDNVARPPKGVLCAVLDTPAGLSGSLLEKVVKASSRIIVPVQASPFDLWATQTFLDQVLEIKAVAKGKAEVALVGMRVAPRTLAAERLTEFLALQGCQTITTLRPTQLYTRVAAAGASIFDVNPAQAQRELEDWAPLLRWVEAA
ncbi:MAG: ParA family protein [Hydrogenophaga sp.]|nr:ParA family protein [Hydrogenophaga sp.]